MVQQVGAKLEPVGIRGDDPFSKQDDEQDDNKKSKPDDKNGKKKKENKGEK